MMVRFREDNRDFLKPWEPRRSPEFFTEGFWQIQLRASIRDFRNGVSLCLSLLDAKEKEVIGVCNFTNIVRGTFQACHLGYAAGERHQGTGMMHEGLTSATDYVFREMGLNRIMASYLPWNERSGRLLKRLDFQIEGEASRYMQINGRWEDHILTSKLNPYQLSL
jgi:ribosomal-protein-alanine N-acetyltransferase